MSSVGPMDCNPGVPSTPMGKENASDPGTTTPMAAGFVDPKVNYTSRTSGSYKNFKREQTPSYK